MEGTPSDTAPPCHLPQGGRLFSRLNGSLSEGAVSRRLTEGVFKGGTNLCQAIKHPTKIDAALKSGADARAALQGALNRKGNCSIGVFTYNGTGKYGPDNPTRITFPRVPAAFIVFGPGAILIGRGGQSQAIIDSYALYQGSTYTTAITLTWSGASCTFYSSSADRHQVNENGLHTVIAFYAES